MYQNCQKNASIRNFGFNPSDYLISCFQIRKALKSFVVNEEVKSSINGYFEDQGIQGMKMAKTKTIFTFSTYFLPVLLYIYTECTEQMFPLPMIGGSREPKFSGFNFFSVFLQTLL